MQKMPILSDSDMSLFELKTRYVRNYLTFAGKNSKDFLLYLSAPGVYDSPEVDIQYVFHGYNKFSIFLRGSDSIHAL